MEKFYIVLRGDHHGELDSELAHGDGDVAFQQAFRRLLDRVTLNAGDYIRIETSTATNRSLRK